MLQPGISRVKHCTHHQAISFPEGKAWRRHRCIFPSWEPAWTTCFIKPRKINVCYQVYTSELSAIYARSWMWGCFSWIYSGSIRYGGNQSHDETPTRISPWKIYTITPPLPTTVQDSRQSRNMMRRSESTSLLTIPKSTTNPSGWGISGVPPWRPNPVPLDLMGSTIIYWNICLRTQWKSSNISWIISGPQETSRTSGEQPLWCPSPNQTRIMLTQIVTDQSRWPAACARS